MNYTYTDKIVDYIELWKKIPYRYYYEHHTEENTQTPICEHWHEGFELIYIEKGAIRLVFNDESVTYCEGHIAVIHPNESHTLYSADRELIYHVMEISEKFFLFNRFHTNIRFSRMISSDVCRVKISKLFALYNGHRENTDQYMNPEISLTLLDLLVYMSKCECENADQESASAKQPDYIKTVIHLIRKNYQKPISIDSLADSVGYSPAHLSRNFKQSMHMSIVSYINLIRCSRAKELLQTTNLSISDISEQCGFANDSYFTRTYKRFYHILPSKDRKAHLQKPET